MKVVLDTNVLISAVLIRNSIPDRIMQAGFDGLFEVVTSRPLLSELDRVVRRPRILERVGWSQADAFAFVSYLSERATLVEPTARIDILRDSLDNRLLEAATAGQADYIVSGDRAVIDLRQFGGIPIVTPARFLAILATKGT